MYIIAGLGNPTKEYENTRHNIGFMAIDALAEKYNISVMECKHKALIGKGMINGNKVVLVKPLTYMNLSGESVRELIDYYKVDEESELIIISDDISLEPGNIRVRKKGSAGGHNGLKDIIYQLSSEEFPRVRLGVGEKPHPDYDLAAWVLSDFSKPEQEALFGAFECVADGIKKILDGDFDGAQMLCNSHKPN